MKTARFAPLNCLFLLCVLSACVNEAPVSPEDAIRNEYATNWINMFGIIDTEQDWNMATSVTADVDPAAFGQGYTVNIYNADPRSGGVLIGRTAQVSTFNLDVAKDAESVFVRAYTPDHSMFCESEYPIANGRVDIRAKSRADMPLSRDDDSEEPEGYQWILACEDLGSVGDYDFNDIVIGINYVAGTDKKLTITPLAAGGILKAFVKYNDENLYESHFPITKETAETGNYKMANTTSWGGPGTPSVVKEGVDFSITENMGGIKIDVIKKDGSQEVETIIQAPETGKAPQIICVPGDWEWPKENTNIDVAYPGFTDWSKNSASSDWNKAKVTGKVVARITESTPVYKHNSIKVTTTDGEPVNIRINGLYGNKITLNSGERYYFTEPLTSCAYMFNWTIPINIKTVDLSDFDASQVTDMKRMFWDCSSLEEIIWGDIETSNVTDMSEMFHDCESLKSIDLSHFDTSNVTDMFGMFLGCTSLTSIDLSSFDTSNATDMTAMFSNCSSLTSIDLSPLDTSNVTEMRSMFSNCSSLTSIDLSPLNTSNVISMNGMFNGCSSLTSIDLRPLDTSNVEYMRGMFRDCSSLTSIDLRPLDTSNVKEMSYMFAGCSSLTSLDLSKFNTSKVGLCSNNLPYSYGDGMNSMFNGCTSITTLDLSSFDTSNVNNIAQMFFGCTSLEKINMANFSPSRMTTYTYYSTFCDCNDGNTVSIYTNDSMKTWLIDNQTNLSLNSVNWLTSWP